MGRNDMDNSWIENGDLDNPGKLIDVIIKKNKKIWFLEGVVVRQKEALERLRKDLDWFGEHKDDCEWVVDGQLLSKCTCGFEQALKEEE